MFVVGSVGATASGEGEQNVGGGHVVGGDGDGVCDVEADQGICISIYKSLLWNNTFDIYQVLMEVLLCVLEEGVKAKKRRIR